MLIIILFMRHSKTTIIITTTIAIFVMIDTATVNCKLILQNCGEGRGQSTARPAHCPHCNINVGGGRDGVLTP